LSGQCSVSQSYGFAAHALAQQGLSVQPGCMGGRAVASKLQHLGKASALDQQPQISGLVRTWQFVRFKQTAVKLLGFVERADCCEGGCHQGDRFAFAGHHLLGILQLHQCRAELALAQVTVGEKSVLGSGFPGRLLPLVTTPLNAQYRADQQGQ